jgi:hypothetical protein
VQVAKSVANFASDGATLLQNSVAAVPVVHTSQVLVFKCER